MAKYYAIKSGHISNIVVHSWDECKKLVDGYANAKYKSFPTEDAAKSWLFGEDEIRDKNPVPVSVVQVFSDGACSGNPGPGGWGSVIKYGGQTKELSGGEESTTNNAMELEGVINGLLFAVEHCDANTLIVIVSDSSYVVNGASRWMYDWEQNGWKKKNGEPVLNLEKWKRIFDLVSSHNVRFEWIKGHNGHSENEKCDQLAVAQREAFSSQMDEQEKVPVSLTNFDLFVSLDRDKLFKLLSSIQFKNFLLQVDTLSIYDMLGQAARDWGVDDIKSLIPHAADDDEISCANESCASELTKNK